MSLKPKTISFDSVYQPLQTALLQMFSMSHQVQGLNLYQMVYDLCTAAPHPFVEELYESLSQFLIKQTETSHQRIKESNDMLAMFYNEWCQYAHAAAFMNQICDYLNRLILKYNQPKVPGGPKRWEAKGPFEFMLIEALALLLWKQNVLLPLQEALMQTIFALANRYRDGQDIPLDVLAQTIQSFLTMNRYAQEPKFIYTEWFEKPFLSCTSEYYKKEANANILSLPISEFMTLTLKRLENERRFLESICDSDTVNLVLKECEIQCIGEHSTRLNDAFELMLKQDMQSDCHSMYLLLVRIPNGLNAILDMFERFIIQCGTESMTQFLKANDKDPNGYIETLYALHAKFIQFKASVFDNDSRFSACIDKGFRCIMNQEYQGLSIKSPEFLARYSELFLKKSIKNQSMNEAELETKMMKMMTLFKFVDDKDIFQKLYTRSMAKRLIYSTSVSEELEVTMMNQLRDTCGAEYTNKLQRMVTDIKLSDELLNGFRQHLKSNEQSFGCKFSFDFKKFFNSLVDDMSMLVLTSGSWPFPIVSNSSFALPSFLEKSMDNFTKFYMSQYNGRKLTWLHYLSRVDVKTFAFDKRYELNVSMSQLAILFLFNDQLEWTIESIKEKTNQTEAEIQLLLKGFLDIGLFKKTMDGIALNLSFKSKRFKVKIPSGTSPVEIQEPLVDSDMEEDRKLFLQATIVRLMKSNKELTHSNLMTLVIDASKHRFHPSIPMIKKCIEQLIEKQYMDRLDKDHYIYIS